MTQLKSQSVVFVDDEQRWVTPLEFLTLQGFPTLVKPSGERCSFDVDIPRNARKACEQSGSPMPLPLMAIPMLYSWLFVLFPASQKQHKRQLPVSSDQPFETSTITSQHVDSKLLLREALRRKTSR